MILMKEEITNNNIWPELRYKVVPKIRDDVKDKIRYEVWIEMNKVRTNIRIEMMSGL